MSLQVWLPLNGNLNNQGLSNSITINSGATIDNNGKIGKCYSLASGNYIGIDAANINNHKYSPISIAMWVYPTQNDSTERFPICCYESGGCGISFKNSCFIFQAYIGGYKTCSSQAVTLNQWYHVCGTYDGTKLSIYINGQLQNTTAASGTITYQATCPWEIGGNPGSTAFGSGNFIGKINDIRIYDHCLSPKEVEEISKGLILHYKLDQNINTMDNCYSYPTFNTSSSNGGWSHWGGSGHIGSYGQNTDKQYIFRKENNYSHWVANDSGATYNYLCYQSPAFDGGFRSLQAIIKEENSTPITEVIAYPAWNARNGGTPNNLWTSITYLGNGFYLCKCEGISQDGSNDLVGIYIQAGYKVYISEAYLENDKQLCSDMFYQNSILNIYDVSGYNNNGTIVGSLQIITSSARYNCCTYIETGASQYIDTPILNFNNESITLNIWFKSSNTSPPSNYHMVVDSISNRQWYEMCINSSGYFRGGLFVNGSRYADNCSLTTALNGQWHMLTLSYDGNTIRRYYDGIDSKDTTIAKSTGLSSPTAIRIGYDGQSSYACTQTFLSDFRIYATALTAAQIKELYDTSVSIDSFGNIHTREVVEI